MIQRFDINKIYETPTFTLCNPDYTERTAIVANNKKAVLRYNDVSEITFEVPEKYSDDGVTKTFNYFKDIEIRRLILVENLGYFQIADVTENDDGAIATKSVMARSLQYELTSKSIDYLNGTYKFYDIVNNFDENGDPVTLMGFIRKYARGWTIGDIDSALINRYRTIDISNRTLLDFIYNDVEEAYQCIFDFDFLNKVINVKAVDSLLATPYNTDIYLSFDNLLQDIEIKEQSDEIRTKLYVYGQDLDIRRVNPTGAAYIINLDYYMNTNWMEQELIDAITRWNNKINTYMDTSSASYATLLSQLNDRNAELTTLNSTMTTLKGELSSLNNIMSVRIEQGIDYSDILMDINAKTAEINAQQVLIDNKKAEIEVVNAQLSVINADCKIENNFTEQQLEQLDKYLIEDTYTNGNYIITDLMTTEEIQTYAKELYDEAKLVLQRISQPRYVFSLNAANFIFLDAFKQFTNQLDPGRIVNIENSKGEILNPVLLKVEYSWDNPSDFSLEFGNRFRLADNTYTYSELVGTATKTSGQINNNWDALITFSKNYKSELNNLINNAFDVALKEIISSSNQDMIWDSSGMTFRKWSELMQTYEDEQIKIINNKIVFTDDAWNTIKTVVGKIALSGGGTAYGIVAEAIIGRLLAGVNLTITNANNSFVIDENGFSFIIPDQSGNEQTVGLEDYISREIDSFAESLDGLVDGKITSFYQDTLPYPVYINVPNNDERNSHIGDIWYNTGYSSMEYEITPYKTYMYQKLSNGSNFDYAWREIEAVPDALYDAVDKKKTVFVSTSENFTPTPPYSVGDLWAQNEFQNGELMVCTTNRMTGNYVASDWVMSNEYNKQLNDFITNTFSPTVTVIEGLVDSKITTFYQNTAPADYYIGQLNSLDDSTVFALAMSRLNDIWYDTINKVAKRYSCDPLTGDIRTFSWVVDSSVPTDLIDIVDGKKTVFVSTSENFTPTPPYSVGDLWAQSEFQNGELMVCMINRASGNYVASDWVISNEYNKQLNDFITNIFDPAVTVIEGLIDSKINAFYQNTAPTDYYIGQLNSINDSMDFALAVSRLDDIWYDTANKVAKKYSCTPTTGDIRTFLWVVDNSVPTDLIDIVDGKKTVFVSTSSTYTPTPPYSVGDLWAQREYGMGEMMVCINTKVLGESFSVSDWVTSTNYMDSLNDFIENTYTPTINTKVESFYQSTSPHNEYFSINDSTEYNVWVGDIWYDITQQRTFMYSKNFNGTNYDYSWQEITAVSEKIYDMIDGKKNIFVSTSESYRPSPPYDTGDLWAQGSYQEGNILVAIKSNDTNYDASDWTLADTSLESFITDTFIPQMDGKINAFYQDTQPYNNYINISSNNVNFDKYSSYVGDIWYDTVNKGTYMYVKVSNGLNFDFNWREIDTIGSNVYDLVDGKNQIFYGFSTNMLVSNPYTLYDHDKHKLDILDTQTLQDLDYTSYIYIARGILNTTIGAFEYNNQCYTVCVSCKPNTSYIISKDLKSNVFRVAYTKQDDLTSQISVFNVYNYDEKDNMMYTTGNEATYLLISYYDGNNEINTQEDVYSSLKVHFDRRPTTPYNVGDLWVQGATGDILVCQYSRTEDESFVMEDWAKASKYTDDSTLDGFISDIYTTDITTLEMLIDSKIDTYYQDGAPNYFIGELNKENNEREFNLALSRLGDIWYDTTNKVAKKYSCTPPTGDNRIFMWVVDNTIPVDLFDVIDGKKTVFVSTSASYTPSPPYAVGDLWTQGTYRDGEILVCKTARLTGNYVASDWTSSNTYAATLEDFINDIQPTIDSKITSYYGTMPYSNYTNISTSNVNYTLYMTRVGDVCYYNDKTWMYVRTANTSNPSNFDFAWKEIEAVPDDLYDTVDKKKQVFYSNSSNFTPTPPYDIGDLWAQGTYRDGELMVCRVARTSGNYVASDWVTSNTYTTTLEDFINDIQPTIDSKITSYYGTMPYTNYTNISTSNVNYTLYMTRVGDICYYNEKTWIYTQTTNASNPSNYDFAWKEIEAVPDDLYDTVDKKKQVFYSNSSNFTPTPPYDVGDLWAQGSYQSGELMVCRVARTSGNYVASDWVTSNQYTTTLSDFINNTFQPAIDGKIDYFWQSTMPHSEYTNVVDNSTYNKWIGDTWYNTTAGKTYVYTKTAGSTSSRYNYRWVETLDEIPQELYDEIDGKKSVYQKRPTSFNVNDIWLYEGVYNSSTNPNSDLMNTPSPSSGYYQSPYVQGTAYTYFNKDDLLVATADSDTYSPSKWKKYNTNIEKSNSSFEFVLNNDGVSITNGNLMMTRGTTSRITLDPTDGIRIQKNTGTSASPIWTNQLYADSTGNLIITGTITATAGSIGGWTISSSTLTAPSSIVGLYAGATSTASSGTYQRTSLFSGYSTVRFWAGSSSPSTATFAVLNDGSLYAGAASITGTINANSGNIVGRLTFGSNNNFYISGNETYRIYMYNSASQYFRVSNTGVLEAANGVFTGAINASGGRIDGFLYFGSNYNYYMDGTSYATYRLYMYNSANQYFRVTNTGILETSGARMAYMNASYVQLFSNDGYTNMGGIYVPTDANSSVGFITYASYNMLIQSAGHLDLRCGVGQAIIFGGINQGSYQLFCSPNAAISIGSSSTILVSPGCNITLNSSCTVNFNGALIIY